MDNWQEQFDKLALQLIGDNVGDGCNCEGCQKNRDKFKAFIQSLLNQQKKELLDKYSIAIKRWYLQHGKYGPSAIEFEAIKQGLGNNN